MDGVWWVVVLGAAAAGFVQGLSGFGFSMVAMSFWAWTLEPRLAAVLAVCGALTGQIVAAATVRRGFDTARLLPFVLGGLAGIPLGVALLPRLDMDAFKLVLGTLLVLWCPAMLLARQLPHITAGGRVADAAVGLSGGVMGGLGGFTGVLPTLWCTLRGLDKDVQRAIIQNFNGKFRDECLNEQWFESLSQARECIARWRQDYNEVRPHSSLGRIPPARFAQQHRLRAGGAAGSEQKQNFD